MSIVKLWRVKGVKGGFTTFFIFILALRCLSQNVGTFQVKRLSVLVKTLRRFCVDDELVWFFHFYFIAIVHDLFVILLYHPKNDSGNFYVTLQLELCPFGSWFYRNNNLTEEKNAIIYNKVYQLKERKQKNSINSKNN